VAEVEVIGLSELFLGDLFALNVVDLKVVLGSLDQSGVVVEISLACFQVCGHRVYRVQCLLEQFWLRVSYPQNVALPFAELFGVPENQVVVHKLRALILLTECTARVDELVFTVTQVLHSAFLTGVFEVSFA